MKITKGIGILSLLVLLACVCSSPLFADQQGGVHDCMHRKGGDPHSNYGGNFLSSFVLATYSSTMATACLSDDGGSSRAGVEQREQLIRRMLAEVPMELEEQAAQGGGPHLAELARLMGLEEGRFTEETKRRHVLLTESVPFPAELFRSAIEKASIEHGNARKMLKAQGLGRPQNEEEHIIGRRR